MQWLEIDQNNLHMKFLASNKDFGSLIPDPLSSRRETVADMHTLHRHAAYHNKQWQQAF